MSEKTESLIGVLRPSPVLLNDCKSLCVTNRARLAFQASSVGAACFHSCGKKATNHSVSLKPFVTVVIQS